MKPAIEVVMHGRSRRLQPGDDPLSIGGPGSDIEVAGAGEGPAAYLGFDAGRLFIQPAEGVPDLVCNGIPLATSRWLDHNDVLRISTGVIRVEARESGYRLEITGDASETPTEPPEPKPSPVVAAHDDRRQPVSPIPFNPADPSRPAAKPRPRLRPRYLALGCLAAVVLAGLWYVVTARAVSFEIEPEPDRVWIEGGLIRPKLAGRHLLLPGEYTVGAELQDHRPLDRVVTVTRDGDQVFRFVMDLLPARVFISTGTVEGAVVEIGGTVVGTTPVDELELPVGEHEMVVRADRHQVHTETIRIDRPGATRRIEVELIPAWAAIAIRSAPDGAQVFVDGGPVGVTPLTAELGAGPHRVELRKEGFKPAIRRIVVVADQPETLPDFRLEPADARVVVNSDPAGATVTVDGSFAGRTPLEVAVEPSTPHTIKVSKAGHETWTDSVELEADVTRRLQVTLQPRFGELRVESTPTGAEILVDGEPQGTTSQTLRLSALPHTIVVRKSGYKPFSTSVEPEPEMLETIHAVLEAEGRPASGTPAQITTSQGAELVLITPGRVEMGASRRVPGRRANESLRSVEVSRPFYLSVHEVTNALFREFSAAHNSGHAGGRSLRQDKHPVVRVTWNDAVRYCNWLSGRDGLTPVYQEKDGDFIARLPLPNGYRLPTEAEWALAARMAGESAPRKFIWGDALPIPKRAGNFGDRSAREILGQVLPDYDDGFAVTAPVGSFDANPLGIFDLGGNVAEWVHDGYTIYPSAAGEVVQDPLGAEEAEYHVIRGASWMDGKLTRIRLSYREYGDEAVPNVGFRIARSAE